MNFQNNPKRPVCAVVGVGPGNGEAFVRAFSQAGYAVGMLARREETLVKLAKQIPCTHAFPCDAGDETSLSAAFGQIETTLGPVDLLIYNAGKGIWGSIEQVTAQDFESTWRVNALGLFLSAKQVIPSMVERGEGSIVVVGATASTRGVAGTAAFAPAKSAQRALTQSMARSLGPKGIHVAHMVIDGIVGGPETRAQFAGRANDAFISPDAIAATALELVKQPRSAWSFELDLRPFNEKW
jgi:NADP-dependent 3-hydroxy acid dehydrogenase YdfG